MGSPSPFDATTRVSVVISTLDRPESLRRTLLALRYQRHPSFEVIVVEGPSVDRSAAEVVDEHRAAIRHLPCPEANLSRSRNIGLDAASGEVVAFIDDDAVPEPQWLTELVAAYDSPRVAGVGGAVYDHTGVRLQYLHAVCDRLGQTEHVRDQAFGRSAPGEDPFPYLSGGNMSFRRRCLLEVGGFDEEIEYNYDEAEVCLRLIDQGHQLRQLAVAPVHHKSLPSSARGADRRFTDPYFVIKNRAYFALRNGRASRSADAVLAMLHANADGLRAEAEGAVAGGIFDADESEFFLTRLNRGLERGIEAGLVGHRRGGSFGEPDPAAFTPFDRLEPRGARMTVCFTAGHPPPEDPWEAELAQTMAAEGHEVHVFTPIDDSLGAIDFEAGEWRHRVHIRDKGLAELEGRPVAEALYLLAALYHEIDRLHEKSPVSLVCAPLSRGQGLGCRIDGRYPAITMLAVPLLPASEPESRLEEEMLARSAHVEASSETILDHVRRTHPELEHAQCFVTPDGDPPPIDVYEAIARSHDGRAGRAGADRGEDLVAVVARAARLDDAESRRVCAQLFDPARYPVDLPAEIERIWSLSEAAFVRGVYSTILRRAPDDAEVAGWLGGAGQPGWRGDMVRETARSPEALSLGLASDWLGVLDRLSPPARDLEEVVDAVHAAEKASDSAFVKDVHRALLGRDPDPGNERACRQYSSAGAARLDIVRVIAALPEARSRGVDAAALMRRLGEPDPEASLRRVWRLPDRLFVPFVYCAVLGREPDPMGLEAYLGQLAHGRSRRAVVREIATSAEGAKRGGGGDWLKRLEASPPAERPRLSRRLSAAVAALGSRAGRMRRRSGSRR